MIEETGKVVEVREGVVLVRAERTTTCDKCVSKTICHSVSETDMVVGALNPVGAKLGDHVVFTVGAGTVIKAGVLMYLLPLLGFIVGVVVGQAFGDYIFPGWDIDIVSAVFGFVFLMGVYLLLYLYGRASERKSSRMPVILRIV